MRSAFALALALSVGVAAGVNPLDIGDDEAAPTVTAPPTSSLISRIPDDDEALSVSAKNISVTDKLAMGSLASDTLVTEAVKTEKADGSQLDGEATPEISIDEVEEHLHILQQLELSVAQSLEELNQQAESPRRPGEASRVVHELLAVQQNLKRLALGLNGTLLELEHVERDTEEQSKKLKQVLEQQKEEQQEQIIEQHGMKAVDYETGRLRNTTGLTEEQLKKLQAVEKQKDPAVLHYDFNLLGQIAVLLGVSAIGGIIATYFNIPPHVGYLLGGALIGPSCLGVVELYKEVETISLFGSIFLLFGHGAGYSPQHPDDVFRRYFIGGMAYIALTVTFVALMSVYIGWVSRPKLLCLLFLRY